MSGNAIRTKLLADFCGLDTSSKCQWEEWILGLCMDDLLLVRGRITQRFGRPNFEIPNNDPTIFLLKYLSELEQEFSNWATSSGEIVDYYLSSMAANLGDTSTTWHWQQKHKSTWLATGRSDELVPHGIRVTPLISDSLENLVEHILEPYVGYFIECLADSVEQREYWISHVETLAAGLYDSVNVACTKVLAELKALRCNYRGKDSLNLLTLSDIANVAHLTESHKVLGLLNYLDDLEEVVSELSMIGNIDFWHQNESRQHERRIIESLLERYRNLGWFEVSGLRLIRDSESSQVVALLDVLRTRLTSQEFLQNTLSIDRIHHGIQSMVGISEWSRRVKNTLQKEIDRTIREYRKGESRYESAPEIDHWRGRKS